ncbi:MAG: hypothetical protein ACAH83_14625 [Alphaproteobacteria bacterium]
MQNEFNMTVAAGLSTRDRSAAEYVLSPAFIADCKEAIMRDIVQAGSSRAVAHSVRIRLKKQDMPYVHRVFAVLQQEFPELNHARLDWNSQGIVLDTKPNTPLRRILHNLDPY